MKNITRLALAFAVAAIACLAPMAHAQVDTSLVSSGIQPERTYYFSDKDSSGTMVVKDGPRYSWGRLISVTIHQDGRTFFGKGWRKYGQEFPGSTSSLSIGD
jgi:hypothetical protein